MGTADGELCVYDPANLSLRHQFDPAAGVPPRFIESSPDGRRFRRPVHDRTLWVYDAAEESLNLAAADGQGDISGIAFGGNDRLLVGDRVSRVSEYELPDVRLSCGASRPNPIGWNRCTAMLFSRCIPIFPKPSEIGDVTAYLIADQKTMRPVESRDGDLRKRQFKLDIWSPIWSNLAFLAWCCSWLRLYGAKGFLSRKPMVERRSLLASFEVPAISAHTILPHFALRIREIPMVLTPSTMLPLGTKAPDFSLPNVDGRTVSLADFRGKPALLVIFMCNHCPYVKHVAEGSGAARPRLPGQGRRRRRHQLQLRRHAPGRFAGTNGA